jgi:hypothetical protein
MSAGWVADLSDGELLQRLCQVGLAADKAERYVRHRDDETVGVVIQELLESGR